MFKNNKIIVIAKIQIDKSFEGTKKNMSNKKTKIFTCNQNQKSLEFS